MSTPSRTPSATFNINLGVSPDAVENLAVSPSDVGAIPGYEQWLDGLDAIRSELDDVARVTDRGRVRGFTRGPFGGLWLGTIPIPVFNELVRRMGWGWLRSQEFVAWLEKRPWFMMGSVPRP